MCAHLVRPPPSFTFPVPQTLRQSMEVGDGARAGNNKGRTGLWGPHRPGVLGSMWGPGRPSPSARVPRLNKDRVWQRERGPRPPAVLDWSEAASLP